MAESRSILIGLGNPILSDDAVGIVVARRVSEALGNPPRVDCVEAAVGGLELVEMIAGYDKAVVVDAIQTGTCRPGEFSCIDFSAISVSEIPALTHRVGLAEAIELARRLDMSIPRTIHVYAIEVEDVMTFGTSMNESVAAAVPGVAAHILAAEFGDAE